MHANKIQLEPTFCFAFRKLTKTKALPPPQTKSQKVNKNIYWGALYRYSKVSFLIPASHIYLLQNALRAEKEINTNETKAHCPK